MVALDSSEVETHRDLLELLRPLEALASRERAFERIDLAPLSDQAALDLLRGLPGGTRDPEALLAELLATSPAWPGSLEEGLIDLRGRGRLRRDASRRLELVDAPGTEDSPGGLDSSLESLSPLEKTLLGVAHLLGEQVDRGLLVEQLSLEEPAISGEMVDATLATLSTRGLVQLTHRGFRFGSGHLHRQCGSLLAAEDRLRLHRQLAGRLSGRARQGPGNLRFQAAEHYLGAGEIEAAREHFLAFAREACARGGDSRGREGYLRALSLDPPPEQRSELLEELARVHLRSGEEEQALTCLREAASLREPLEQFPLLEEEARILQTRGELDQAEELFTRLRDLAREESGSRPALLPRMTYRLGCVSFDRGDLERTEELFRESLALYRELDDLAGAGTCRMGLGMVARRRGDLAESGRHLQSSIEAFEQAGQSRELASALNNLAIVQRIQGQNGEAIHCLRRAIEVRQGLGDRQGKAVCLNNLSRVLWYLGDLPGARDSAGEALHDFLDLGHLRGVLTCSSNLGAFELYQGNLEQAATRLTRTLDLARHLSNPRAELDTLTALALLAQTWGDEEKAREYLEAGDAVLERIRDPDYRAVFQSEKSLFQLRSGDAGRAREIFDRAWEELADKEPTEARGLLLLARAELEHRQDDLEAARDSAEEAAAIFRQTGPGIQRAIADRVLARIYRDLGPDWADRAEHHFDAALVVFEKMGTPLELAETLVEIARFWSYLGEPEEALGHLEEAFKIFRQHDVDHRIEQLEQDEDFTWP